MRKLCFYAAFLLLLSACNENAFDVGDKSIDALTRNSNVSSVYSFQSATSVWNTFQNLEEMQAACQIPKDILATMSTDDLIETCMNYPLYGNYLAYNNELTGIEAVMSHFNGFQELKNRVDAPKKILDYYQNFDISQVANKIKSTGNSNTKNSLHLGYLELIIASDLIPQLYEESYINRLESIESNKYEEKFKYTVSGDIFTIRKSLLIGARIKLKLNTVSADDEIILKEFVDNGGNMTKITDYSKVSQIIVK